MKKFWILPVTALMISCGAATEEAPAATPVEEVVAPVEEVEEVEEVAPVADSTMEEAAADSTMEEAPVEEAHDGHDH